MMKQIKL